MLDKPLTKKQFFEKYHKLFYEECFTPDTEYYQELKWLNQSIVKNNTRIYVEYINWPYDATIQNIDVLFNIHAGGYEETLLTQFAKSRLTRNELPATPKFLEEAKKIVAKEFVSKIPKWATDIILIDLYDLYATLPLDKLKNYNGDYPEEILADLLAEFWDEEHFFNVTSLQILRLANTDIFEEVLPFPGLNFGLVSRSEYRGEEGPFSIERYGESTPYQFYLNWEELNNAEEKLCELSQMGASIVKGLIHNNKT